MYKRQELNCFWPQSLCVQGRTLSFTSGGAAPLLGHDPEVLLPFRYFLGKGVALGPLADVPEQDISVMHCEFEDGGLFSAFDPAFPLDLSLTVGPESKELPIHQTHIMTIGGNPKEERFAFKKPDGTECGYYLNDLFLYTPPRPDPRHEREAAEQMRAQGLSERHIMEIQKSQRDVCPAGHKILVLEYESEGDVQLSFYTAAYLSAAPERTNGAASAAILVSNDEKGPHGHRKQYCAPVSYTHLDVYKRQRRKRGERGKWIGILCFRAAPKAVFIAFPAAVLPLCFKEAVSYTHLDVYKRQS